MGPWQRFSEALSNVPLLVRVVGGLRVSCCQNLERQLRARLVMDDLEDHWMTVMMFVNGGYLVAVSDVLPASRATFDLGLTLNKPVQFGQQH